MYKDTRQLNPQGVFKVAKGSESKLSRKAKSDIYIPLLCKVHNAYLLLVENSLTSFLSLDKDLFLVDIPLLVSYIMVGASTPPWQESLF